MDATVDDDRSWLRPSQVVLGLTLLLLAGAAGCWVLLDPGRPAVRDLPVPWPVLLVMFVVAEVVVLHVQVRQQAQTVALSEIPLVLGLLAAPPREVLVARVLGSLIAFVAFRRQPVLKTLFNTALVAAGTCAALLVLPLVLAGAGPWSPRGWLAVYAATGAASLLDGVAVTLVIAVLERTVRLRETLRESLHAVATSAAVTTVALTAANDISAHPIDLVLQLAEGVILVGGFRAYASLTRRHLGLERVYRFSQVLSHTPEVDEVLRRALDEAKQILRADVAEATLLHQDGQTGARVALGQGGRLVRSDTAQDEGTGWLRRTVIDTGAPALLARHGRDAEAQGYLRGQGWRDAVLVPLRGDAGVIGALVVADRLGDIGSFTRDDVLLLETVAAHASLALQNGQLLDQLRHESLHDALTGLPNRASLQRSLQAMMDDLLGGVTASSAVLLLDLDGFKAVNDTLGHAQGDRLLQEVGRRLVDTVGGAGSVARLGGDEFAVLLPGAGADAGLRVGSRVLHALEQPVLLDGLEVEIGASIGVALAPEHGQTGPLVLRRADTAMYAAKGSTRGVRLYEPDHDHRNGTRITMTSELRQALQDGSLQVHVQPQGRFRDGRVVAVEALARWHHPQLGQVPPDEFIPVAERSGLIAPLTSFVLDRALAACATWWAAGHPITVAVNLSPRSLLDTDLLVEVRRLLARHRLPGAALTLEVTESGVMADPVRAVALLQDLRGLGVRLSVDDFGTGYSSLSYLKRLPVQEVKIDKSFVVSLTTDTDDQAIARSIVDLGRHLGLDIVAEGVEDQASWDLLRDMGCTLAQGWHLSRPMPTDELLGWLQARARPRPADQLPV